jgi:DNA-binding MarR family transcriptional regulator
VKDLDAGAAGPAGAAATAAPPVPQAFAADLLTAIGAVRRTTRRATRRASPAEQLAPTRSELLRLAASRPGITVAEAARELRLAPNTVSTMVGDLASQGLISRGRSSTDGRAVRLSPTSQARHRLAEWRDLRAELTARALSELPVADQEALGAAIPALARLAGRMEAVSAGRREETP